MKPSTLEWIKKAEVDHRDSEQTNLSPDLLCFLSQQCVEKYIKGYLNEEGVVFPKSHDLERLLELCLPLQPEWEAWRVELGQLTRFAAEYRYPGGWAELEDAAESIATKNVIRKTIRTVMNLGE